MVDLLSVGANVDTVASNGLTPLMYAARLVSEASQNCVPKLYANNKTHESGPQIRALCHLVGTVCTRCVCVSFSQQNARAPD